MTYEEEIRARFLMNQKIANFILVFLLLVRLVDEDLAIWIFGQNVPDWVPYAYNGIAYFFTATIIFLNRHRLAELNIDRPFLVFLAVGGITFAFHSRSGIGALVAIVGGMVYWLLSSNFFVLGDSPSYSKETSLLLILSVLLALAPILIFKLVLRVPLDFQGFVSIFLGSIQSFLALIVFEEVIFRGALWSFLQGLKLGGITAFCLQGLLFWFAHYKVLSLGHQYSFWVAIPCISILLGLLAWRSKSLTPSTLGHFLYNFISQLLLVHF